MTLTAEQMRIAGNLTMDDELEAKEIHAAYMRACEAEGLLLKEFSLAMVFKMGMIQGIRNERRRRGNRA